MMDGNGQCPQGKNLREPYVIERWHGHPGRITTSEITPFSADNNPANSRGWVDRDASIIKCKQSVVMPVILVIDVATIFHRLFDKMCPQGG